MSNKKEILPRALLLLTSIAIVSVASNAKAASCSTQSQMNPALRTGLTGEAHTIAAIVLSGDTQALRVKKIGRAHV